MDSKALRKYQTMSNSEKAQYMKKVSEYSKMYLEAEDRADKRTSEMMERLAEKYKAQTK